MPYTPVTFGTMAGYARGDLFDPVNKLVKSCVLGIDSSF